MIYDEIFTDVFKDILKSHKIIEFDVVVVEKVIAKIKVMSLTKKCKSKQMAQDFISELVMLCEHHQVDPTEGERKHLCDVALQVCDWVRRGRRCI